MRVFLAIAAFAYVVSVHAQTEEAKTRPPTQEEIKSFNAFYKQRYSVNRVPDVDFSVNRSPRTGDRLVQASVFILLGKGLRGLCHGEAYRYAYNNHDSKHPSWEPLASHGKEEYVWIGNSSCGDIGKRILVTSPLPDMDALDLLENADRLWRKHSQLIAGNSACERAVRSDLKLASIGVDRNFPDPESMFQITYSAGSNGLAEIFLHKKGKDLMPWSVRCTLP